MRKPAKPPLTAIKNKRGLVGLSVDKGYLRLQFPAKISEIMGKGGKQTYLGLNLEYTWDNLKKAESLVTRINADIEHPEALFDPSLEKYLGIKQLEVLEIKTIGQIWDKYCEYHLPGKAQSTAYSYQVTYKSKLRPFLHLPISTQTANKIRGAFLKNATHSSKKAIAVLAAAVDWALNQEIINSTKNPFKGMSREIKYTSRIDPITGVKPEFVAFSLKEIKLILKAFSQDIRGQYYYNVVKFLFFTGCRTGEALAVTWKDILFDKRRIAFTKTYHSFYGLSQGSKNHKTRLFPMNKSLTAWLQLIQPEDMELNQVCFPGKTNKYICNSTLNRVWGGHSESREKGIVYQLAEQGLIANYLPLYNTRHSFINLCIDAGIDTKVIGSWCDNSSDIIEQVYWSKERQFNYDQQLPSF